MTGKVRNVGILNFPGHMNQGANLTAYALQHTLRSMGCNAANLHLMSNYVLVKDSKYTDFADAHIRMTEKKSWGEFSMQQYNKDFDTFIVGSDQVWRYIDGEGMFGWKTYLEPCYYLGFAESGKRRIAMAASFGRDDYSAPEPVRKRCGEELKRFAAISVREKSAVDMVKAIADVEVAQVIDPVFHLSAAEWNAFAAPVQPGRKGSFVAYNSFFSGETIKELELKLNGGKAFVPLLAGNTKDWLANIRDARFIISDSYHVCCFCLIYGTPFAALSCKDQGKARFDELAEYFGFDSRRIIDTSEVTDLAHEIRGIMELPFDAESIWKKIADGSECSKRWLQDALDAPVPEWSGSSFVKASSASVRKERMANRQARMQRAKKIRYYVCALLYYICPFRRAWINDKYASLSRIVRNFSW